MHLLPIHLQKENMEGLPPAVVHCFTGTKEELEEYLAMGMYIGTRHTHRTHTHTHTTRTWEADESSAGITGWVCDERRGRHLQEIVGLVPLDRLMIETDAPFLTPRTLRPCPRRNEPSYLTHVLQSTHILSCVRAACVSSTQCVCGVCRARAMSATLCRLTLFLWCVFSDCRLHWTIGGGGGA
jgi:Tat protein secretion system quality control protein TatD with DNase activity